MKADAKKILGASGGAFAGGVAMKTVKSPITPLAVLGLGIYLATNGKNETQKSIGLGLASVGAIGTAGKVAEKVEAMQSFTPTINGLQGELYEDEDGNIIELGGLDGAPQLVQDEYGNTYMVNGLEGDDYEEADDYEEELLGLSGGGGDKELTELV